MKKNSTSNFTFIYTLVLFFCIQSVFSQLTTFSLVVTKTDETCTGNGALSFSVTGITPDATVFYAVYLQPDIITPIAVVNTPSLGGLAAGNYHVVATQSLGALSNTAQYDIEILDIRLPLVYDVVGQPINCLTGSITVNVTQGTVATYEISAGAVIVSPQTSNVFSNLPMGQYTIKVTDVCNDVLVLDFTLVYVFSPTDLIIREYASTTCDLIDCETKEAIYFIRAPVGMNILYPYEVELTVFPPNGAIPIIIQQTISSGDTYSESISIAIPHYNAVYSTSIKFTDLCGNVFEQSDIDINGFYDMSLESPSSCHKGIYINTCNLIPPLTVSFLSSPLGFNPSTFNPLGLGPFDATEMSYAYNATTLTDVPHGDYNIQITDTCGVVIERHIKIESSSPDYSIEYPRIFDGCILPNFIHIPDQGIPINTAVITEAPPGYDQTIPYDVNSLIVSHTLEMILTVPGIYTFEGIDVCGKPYLVHVVVPVPNIKPYIIPENIQGCTNFHGSIKLGFLRGTIEKIFYEEGPVIASVTITQAPAEFLYPLPYDASSFIIINPEPPPTISSIAEIPDLPVGDYTLHFTDICGTIYGPYTVTVPLLLNLDVIASVLEGCEIGFGSMRLSNLGDIGQRFQTVIMTAAPASSAFAALLPYNVSFNIASGGYGFTMNTLPEGDYTFYTKDICGVENTTDVTIGNHFYDTTVEVDGNCGSFNLFLHDASPPGLPIYYALQKWNPLFNLWGHPITGAPSQPGNFPNGVTAYFLSENNYNIVSQGTFRIVKINFIFSNGISDMISCQQTLKEFDFLGTLKITDAYKISCVSGSSQVFIVAGDTNPLHYYITEKDGLPYAVDNENSNVFNGLLPGIYNFLVRDLCGNEVNRLFDVTSLSEPVVTPSGLCEGQAGQLSVPPFSFLNYQWWKSDDPNTILSSSNVLHFNPFSTTTTPGTYYVRVYSTSVLSCIDTTISYTIPDAIDPHAGDDNALTICARGVVNLNTLLSGLFAPNGIWSEITTSGMLNGNIWLPLNLAGGTYQFKYTVNGFCGQLDDAIITINLLEMLPTPIVTMNQVFCAGNDIHFNVENIPGVTFQWTGPNNFTSNEQNPIIENSTLASNGLYTVTASVNGCDSDGMITVALKTGPDFHLNASCVNDVYTVAVVPNEGFLDNVTYAWTGPENYTNNQNPIQIAGLSPGMYGVTVVSADGCLVYDEIPVNTTVCSLPNVITPNDDFANDNFDLSAFDVNRIEIYSRWGRLVYDQNNYTNQWHGQNNNNQLLPDSTYFYILYLGSGEEKQGWVFVNGNN